MFVNLLGVAGGALFAFAAVPAAFKTWQKGESLGTPISIAWAIFFGCILMYNYLTFKFGFDLIIIAIYFIETVSWSVIIKYHYAPTHRWARLVAQGKRHVHKN